MEDRPAAVRALTRGPHHHWFGYYDKFETDPAERFVLANQVDFEGRSPTADDHIRVGMVDRRDGDHWIELGESRAWCWQQGCMLQWLPGSDRQVIWNDRQQDRFVAHLLDTHSGERRTLDWPVYALSPDGRWAVFPDFRRIQDTRPGYGYAGLPDPAADRAAPDDAGIWRLDLDSGRAELIVTLAEVAAIPYPGGDIAGAKHWFNHLLVSPDGSRFIFLNRWTQGDHWGTRMLTAAPDGSDIRVIEDRGNCSHFIWRDPQTILVYVYRLSQGDNYYLIDEASGRAELAFPAPGDGHVTCLPGGAYFLTDTYPRGGRYQDLWRHHLASGRQELLARFHSPEAYAGEWRCDLHPRASRDGRTIFIDSVHEGKGRQLYAVSPTD